MPDHQKTYLHQVRGCWSSRCFNTDSTDNVQNQLRISSSRRNDGLDKPSPQFHARILDIKPRRPQPLMQLDQPSPDLPQRLYAAPIAQKQSVARAGIEDHQARGAIIAGAVDAGAELVGVVRREVREGFAEGGEEAVDVDLSRAGGLSLVTDHEFAVVGVDEFTGDVGHGSFSRRVLSDDCPGGGIRCDDVRTAVERTGPFELEHDADGQTALDRPKRLLIVEMVAWREKEAQTVNREDEMLVSQRFRGVYFQGSEL